jgi:hypothetical protein
MISTCRHEPENSGKTGFMRVIGGDSMCTVAAPARNALRLADFREITLVIPTPKLTILWMNDAGSPGHFLP